MLEKPDIPDRLITSRFQEEYGLHLTGLTFLPIGADMNSAVYRVTAENEIAYFLKLRRNFDEITVSVPLFLKSQGIQAVIVPFETKSKRHWVDLGEYKMILYPFIEGENSFEMDLSDEHKRILGAALKRMHSARVPPELKKQIPRESFDSGGRELVKSLQVQVESKTFDDPTAAKLAGFMKSKRIEITRLVERAEGLASEIQSKSLELVLCHSDIHRANILIGDKNQLYLVDWDDPILAPKERDLMFIGGGIDYVWKSEREEAVFYEGYGKAEIDLLALAYYRYERIIQDLASFAEQLLLTKEGGADREQAYKWFISNFEPGSTIEIANNTYLLSR